MAAEEDGEPTEALAVEAARAYRDRLVLKLEGLDDASAAAARRGRWVRVRKDEEAPLPEGRWYLRDLTKREVQTIDGCTLGVVETVVETGGVDLLSVRTGQGKELLIPMAPSILLEVGEDGPLRVDLPEGLTALEGD